MAHGLEKTQDMVYNSQGGKPWHGLGTELPGPMTAQEVLQACPRFADPVLKVPAELDGRPVPGHYFTVRQDDRTVLGHVGTEYQVAQNADLLKVAESYVMDPNGPFLRPPESFGTVASRSSLRASLRTWSSKDVTGPRTR